MAQEERTYLAIDLKSFYASVECVERGLDPLMANLVVADASRTEKTICLAVSPSLKTYGIPGRARLFEVVETVRQVNRRRAANAPGGKLQFQSHLSDVLQREPAAELAYIVAPPRMALYMEYSARIYQIYLQFIAPEDIHVYSVDEVFIDVTHYLPTYRKTAEQLAAAMIHQVLRETGITATAGIGPNLYLCKIAMDIMAKRIQPDRDGVRIAKLDEMEYRRQLWNHQPLTDFWRVGPGICRRLAENGLYTMGDVARCALGAPNDFHNEALLYRLLGVNAELLIDHAFGYEPCTIADIKAYKPQTHSMGAGQVLKCPYPFDKARLVLEEMADALSLDLVERGVVAEKIVLMIGYDIENLTDNTRTAYRGELTTDRYGRSVPKEAHGSEALAPPSSSSRRVRQATLAVFDRIADRNLTVRRINLTAAGLMDEREAARGTGGEQLSLFADNESLEARRRAEEAALVREKRMQKAVIDIKKKYGKNAILKGLSLEDGATATERNQQIGGHKA